MPTSCSCCSFPDPKPLFHKDGYWYAQCMACSHAWLEGGGQARGDSLYGIEYFEGAQHGGYADYVRDELLHRKNARARLDVLESVRRGVRGALLDVGCAVGFFLDEARREQWNVRGVDVSSWAREQAKARFDLTIYESLEEAAKGGPYDAVTFFQVLEHMPDPAQALQVICSALRTGGTLLIETWDRGSTIARLMGAHWQEVTPPSVVHLFSLRSLTLMLERTGFQGVDARRSAKSVGLGFVGSLLHQKYPRAAAPLHWLTSQPWLRQRAITYRLGDLITVFARRR